MNGAITSTASMKRAKSSITRSDSSTPSGISPYVALNVETPVRG